MKRRATGDGYADFLLSHTRNKAFGAGPARVEMRDAVLATYLSDEWLVSPALTVNLGVRYEAYWQPAAYNLAMTNWHPDLYRGVGSPEAAGIVQGGKNGVPASTVHNDMNNLMPRLGTAWRFADHWVIRTGAGLYFDQRVGQVAQQAFSNPPVFRSVEPDCSVANSGCVPVSAACAAASYRPRTRGARPWATAMKRTAPSRASPPRPGGTGPVHAGPPRSTLPIA